MGTSAEVGVLDIGNFRSIKKTRLDLDRLTVLLGGNGAGKSNVVDVFRFISEALSLGLFTALERRAGIQAVRHRIAGTGGNPRAVRLALGLKFPNGFTAEYAFSLSSKRGGVYHVGEERCRVWTTDHYCFLNYYLRGGRHVRPPELAIEDFMDIGRDKREFAKMFIGRVEPNPEALALPLMGGMPGIKSMLDALRSLRTYSIVPDVIRDPQDPDEGRVLASDGANASSVWRSLTTAAKSELVALLAHAVPGIESIRSKRYGKKRGLEFIQRTQQGRNEFDAHQMSDGTLRLFGILLALLQPAQSSLIALEEPEVSIHLGALAALVEVLRTKAEDRQIVITSHNADLADFVGTNELRMVRATPDGTQVSKIAKHSVDAIREELFSPGELLRAGGLHGEGQSVAAPVEPSK
jgi:type I restriction enzyme M protein